MVKRRLLAVSCGRCYCCYHVRMMKHRLPLFGCCYYYHVPVGKLVKDRFQFGEINGRAYYSFIVFLYGDENE